MIKKAIIMAIILLLTVPVAAPAEIIDCVCNSHATISMLDLSCKSYCGELFGLGTCVGWWLDHGRCTPSGAICETKWTIKCADESEEDFYASDHCFQCPFFEDPGSGGGNNTQTTMPIESELEPEPQPDPESDAEPKSAENQE